jgi:hypothetical protein
MSGVWEVKTVEFGGHLYVDYADYQSLLEKYTNAMEVMLIEDREYWEVEDVREQEAKAVLEENKVLKGQVAELEKEKALLYKANVCASQRLFGLQMESRGLGTDFLNNKIDELTNKTEVLKEQVVELERKWKLEQADNILAHQRIRQLMIG